MSKKNEKSLSPVLLRELFIRQICHKYPPDVIVDAAILAAGAGASILHLHARDPIKR